MRRQKNRYELTLSDGSKQTIIANSYSEAINACHVFCINAVQVQRICKNGITKKIKNV